MNHQKLSKLKMEKRRSVSMHQISSAATLTSFKSRFLLWNNFLLCALTFIPAFYTRLTLFSLFYYHISNLMTVLKCIWMSFYNMLLLHSVSKLLMKYLVAEICYKKKTCLSLICCTQVHELNGRVEKVNRRKAFLLFIWTFALSDISLIISVYVSVFHVYFSQRFFQWWRKTTKHFILNVRNKTRSSGFFRWNLTSGQESPEWDCAFKLLQLSPQSHTLLLSGLQ